MDISAFLTFTQMMKVQNKNPAMRWHKPGSDPDDVNGWMAFQRVGREHFRPLVRPSFKISKDSKFFMIGSCFARGLESALKGQGLHVLSLSKKFDSLVSVEGTTPLGVTNRYNTGSILNEVRWALDPDSEFPEQGIIDLNDGTSIDPHMNPALAPTDRVETIARRNIYHDVMSSVAHADVLVLTLGLVEVWFDRELGLVLNSTPSLPMIRKHPERFVFGRLRYQDNLQNLNEIHRLMQAYGKAGHRIVITVSPVPLGTTFTPEDIVEANTYSKSTLRAVATDFAESHHNVEYFPSYEIVMNSHFDSSWIADKRHPQGRLGSYIMRTFVEHYVEDIDAGGVVLAQDYVA